MVSFIKKSGHQCRRHIVENNGFCWQHYPLYGGTGLKRSHSDDSIGYYNIVGPCYLYYYELPYRKILLLGELHQKLSTSTIVSVQEWLSFLIDHSQRKIQFFLEAPIGASITNQESSIADVENMLKKKSNVTCNNIDIRSITCGQSVIPKLEPLTYIRELDDDACNFEQNSQITSSQYYQQKKHVNLFKFLLMIDVSEENRIIYLSFVKKIYDLCDMECEEERFDDYFKAYFNIIRPILDLDISYKLLNIYSAIYTDDLVYQACDLIPMDLYLLLLLRNVENEPVVVYTGWSHTEIYRDAMEMDSNYTTENDTCTSIRVPKSLNLT